uniref:Putative ribonuclease H-like domain-containing protein n=1 Tax=Tanacetum cinerariifolium TaxID=118510 RepID=A0A6L2J3V7_TANCI|nr:putative ribonuclease H-like domain-containing protein [Tanacetum cinerariifolium]
MKKFSCFKQISNNGKLERIERRLSLGEYKRATSWSSYIVSNGGEIKSKGERDEELEWRADMSQLYIGDKFAMGKHSRIYRGVYKEKDVAVKLISQPEEDRDLASMLERQFTSEVVLLFGLHHPNIITFFAACKKPPVFCIINEYLAGGSLRDLKSENLLLDEDMCVKVADFGISCLESQCGSGKGFTGTYRWMAPEMIKEKKHTKKVDVYSFAIVMWELLTALTPFDDMTPEQAAFAVCQKNARPPLPASCPGAFCELISRCWSTKPDKRPTFDEIVKVLERYVASAKQDPDFLTSYRPSDDRTLFKCYLSPQVVSAAKLPILNPNEFDIWKMRIEQYFLMTDYSLWEVILNGDSPALTRVEGILQPVALTTAEQRLARKNELKAHGTLLMALLDKHQLKFNSHKDAKTLMEVIEKSTTEPVSAAASVSTVFAKMPVSSLPNVDSSSNAEGIFRKECRSPKDSRRNEDEPTNYAFMAFSSSSSSSDNERIETKTPHNIPSFVQSTEQVKSPRPSVQHVETFIPAATPKPASPKPTSNGKRRNKKACFVCKSLDHLIKDYDYHEKNIAQPTARNHAHRGIHKQYAQMTPLNPQRHMVPAALLTQSKPVPITAVRSVSTAVPKTSVTRPKQVKPIVTKPNSPNRRHINHSPSPKVSNSSPRVTAIKAPVVNAAQGNMSYISDFEELNGGYVAFGGNPKGGKISRKVSGPTWLFDIDTLTKTMNYQLVTAGNQSNPSAGVQEILNAEKTGEEIDQQYVLFPVWSSGSTNHQNIDGDATFDEKEPEFDEKKPESEVNVSLSSSAQSKKHDDKTKKEAKRKNLVETLTGYRNLSVDFKDFSDSINEVNAAGTLVPITGQISPNNTNTFSAAGLSNAAASPTHGKSSCIDTSQLFNDLDIPELEDITYSDDEDDVGAEADFNNLETSITVSPIPTIRVHKDHPVTQIIGDLSSATQTRSMKVWVLVDLPYGKRAIGTKWVFKNKKDKRGIVVRNKARLVAQGYTQEEEIDYEEVFAPVARIEAIRFILAYASFMGFMVYQMDVKSAFLYGTIEEEALYGLHQAPRAWYETLANYLLENGFQRGKIDQTLFIKRQKGDILLIQIYVDDIIFGSTNKDLCKAFEKLMKDKFQMSSMGELEFFLGLQVKQKKDGIFISQDKYVAEILRKFGLTDRKSASTPIDTEKPLLKDLDGEDVDVHTYRSMIGSLMYLSSSRSNIMFAVCTCARFQVTPKASHLHAVKRIFRYLKGKPHLGLWYQKDSPFDLVAYSDSDYAGASLDKKSTTGGCQFFGCRLISCQCKKQTVLATSSIEAEYVAAASCCAQVLWIQNQLLDYGLQALVDKKKVVVTEATIRDALRLDDAEELARMGYEKPSTKLTFYKVFFSSQWKFLIHTILQCMSTKQTSWNEFSSSMASAVICLSSGRKFIFSKYIFDSLVRNVDSPSKFYMYPRFLQLIIIKQVGDLSTYTTKYTSPALTQKVFANMRRVGKGFSRVKTQLFEGMLVAQEVEQGDADENVENVNAGDAAEGDVSAANDEVPTADEEPSIQSPTPPTPPPQPYHDIPSTSQLKRRVKKLERRNKAKVLKLRRLQKVGTAERIDTSDDTVMDDVSNQGRMISDIDVDADVVLEEAKEVAADAKADQDTKVDESVDIQGRQAKSQAEIYKIDLDHDNKVLSMQEEESEPVELQEVVDIVIIAKIITEVVTAASTTITAAEVLVLAATTTAAPKLTADSSRRTKGVVIRDPEESSTTLSTIIHSEAKSKDNGKGILVEEPKPLKKYQAMKRKPQTEAQARKNMMVYLKNVAGFKMDYFKGMTYDDICPVFEKHYDLNVAFLQKTKEQIDKEESRALKRINETPAEKAAKRKKLEEEVEELKRHLQIVPNEDDDVYTKATLLARKVPVVDYEIINQKNKPYYKVIRADGTHQLYISFLSLLRNFNREDLEALWSLVKERFATAKPKNFSNDFLLITLGVIFKKPDMHA